MLHIQIWLQLKKFWLEHKKNLYTDSEINARLVIGTLVIQWIFLIIFQYLG